MTAPAVMLDTPFGKQPAPPRPDPRTERDAAWLARPFNESRFRAASVAVVLSFQDNRRQDNG